MDCVILAAGKGTRMNSSTPKVLHKAGGKTLIDHLLRSLDPLELNKVIVVVGYKEQLVKDSLADREVQFAIQKEQKGTAHALQQAKGKIESDDFLVLPGDLPLIRSSSLKEFSEFSEDRETAISLLTVKRDDPRGYGRIKRDQAGNLYKIVEHQDATEAERKIKEVNTGIYLMSNRGELWQELDSIDSSNAQGEFYLTDLIRRFSTGRDDVAGFLSENAREFLGVNTREDLAVAGKELNQRKISSLFEAGITVIEPDSTIIDVDVEIGRDTIIEPFTIIRGNTTIGSEARIGPNVEIVDGTIGTKARVSHAVIRNSAIKDNTAVEPFSFIGADQTT